MTDHGDLPKDELLKLAEETIASYASKGTDAQVFFKATCPVCGERPMFQEPNMVYDNMECCYCGITFPFTVGGFMLALKRS